MAQTFLHTLVFFADRLMLGRHSADALAQMQISGALLWSIFSIFSSFSAGTVAVVARAVGEGDREKARRSAGAALALGLWLGLAVGAAVAGFAPRLVSLYRPEPGIAALARDFAGTVGLALPLLFVGFAGTTVLRAAGDTRTPMYVAILTNVVNVFGNYVLIFGKLGAPELGVRGAAIATGTAWAVEAVLIVAVLLSRRGALSLSPRDVLLPSLERLRAIARVTGPATLEAVVFHGGFQLFVGIVASLGGGAMAAQQACVSIESFSFLPAEAFGIAAATIVGQKLGAGRPEEARAGARVAALLGVLLLSTLGVVYLVLAGPLVALFLDDPAVRGLARTSLRIGALEQPTLAAAVALAHALRGAGDTRSPLVVTLAGVWVVRLGLSYGLAIGLGLGLPGIWMATAVDWGVRALLLLRVWRRGAWVRAKV